MKSEGRHADGSCQIDIICKHSAHNKHPRKKHILVCQDNCELEEKKKTLEEYKSRFILPQKCLEEFSTDIKLSFLSYGASSYTTGGKKLATRPEDGSVIDDNSMYILQQIQLNDSTFALFFDTGCRYSAVQKIQDRSCQEISGPINLGGVGECKMESPHGIYQVKLPLYNGKNAVLSGICLDKM